MKSNPFIHHNRNKYKKQKQAIMWISLIKKNPHLLRIFRKNSKFGGIKKYIQRFMAANQAKFIVMRPAWCTTPYGRQRVKMYFIKSLFFNLRPLPIGRRDSFNLFIFYI